MHATTIDLALAGITVVSTLGLGALGVVVLPWREAEVAASHAAWVALGRLPGQLMRAGRLAVARRARGLRPAHETAAPRRVCAAPPASASSWA